MQAGRSILLMAKNGVVRISNLRESELGEAVRIVRLAFGTFLGLPDPMQFMGDRDLMTPRWRARNTRVLAAHIDGRLVGSNVITRWGSFGFFGPLTVLPEFWDHGVAQRLLEGTVKVLDGWELRRSGLFTFPHSAKHVGLYNKFGYWPQHLTALFRYTPPPVPESDGVSLCPFVPLSLFARSARELAITACRKLANSIDKGLDLTEEIQSLLRQHTGEVLLAYTRATLDGFAIAFTGPGSEGGSELCYVKFAAVRGGPGADARFDRLLDACEYFAGSRNVALEFGVNFACEAATRRMRARGRRALTQGVAMQRPSVPGFYRPDAYVLSDLR